MHLELFSWGSQSTVWRRKTELQQEKKSVLLCGVGETTHDVCPHAPHSTPGVSCQKCLSPGSPADWQFLWFYLGWVSFFPALIPNCVSVLPCCFLWKVVKFCVGNSVFWHKSGGETLFVQLLWSREKVTGIDDALVLILFSFKSGLRKALRKKLGGFLLYRHLLMVSSCGEKDSFRKRKLWLKMYESVWSMLKRSGN